MIISDTPMHKVDAVIRDDGWLVLTAFHLPNLSATEWKTKIMGLSREAQKELVQLIVSRWGQE